MVSIDRLKGAAIGIGSNRLLPRYLTATAVS
jgi:hypothetical protein